MEALALLLIADGADWGAQALRSLILLIAVPFALRGAAGAGDPFVGLYGPRLGTLRFVLNLLWVPLLALALMLVGFAFLLPEFGAQLAGNPEARPFILRQLALEGLVPGLIVNFLAVGLASSLRPRLSPGLLVAADALFRLAAFAMVLALIYVFAARGLGSFSGSPATALGVVAPTLAAALRLEAGTGLSLYAAVLSAFPLWTSALLAVGVEGLRGVPGGRSGAAAGMVGAALALVSALLFAIAAPP